LSKIIPSAFSLFSLSKAAAFAPVLTASSFLVFATLAAAFAYK